jgi:hypothetical protein
MVSGRPTMRTKELRCYTDGRWDSILAVPFRAVAALFWRVTGNGPHVLARIFAIGLVGVVTVQAFVFGMSLTSLVLGIVVTIAICFDMLYTLPRYEAAFSNAWGSDRLPVEAAVLLDRVARRRPFWAVMLTGNCVWQAVGGGAHVGALVASDALFAFFAVGQDYLKTCSFPPGRTIRERISDLVAVFSLRPTLIPVER